MRPTSGSEVPQMYRRYWAVAALASGVSSADKP